MRRTRFLNAISGLTVGTSINATNTTLDVLGASALPAEGDFNLFCDAEIMLATHRTGNSVTVVRGVDGSTGASHDSAVAVTTGATKTAMDKIKCDAGFNCGANPNSLTVNTANFSWANQGTSSLIQNTWGGITLQTQNAASHSMRIAYISAPSEPWTLTAKVKLPPTSENGVSGSHGGLILGDSGSTRWETLSARLWSGFSWWRWNSETNWANSAADHDLEILPTGAWMRWVNNGVTIQPFVSIDGENWLQMASSLSKGAWLNVNGPDQIGFYYSNHQTDGELFNLDAWLVT